MAKKAGWFLLCPDTNQAWWLTDLPLTLGRRETNDLVVPSLYLSAVQFTISKALLGGIKLTNESQSDNYATVDGEVLTDSISLAGLAGRDDLVHLITIGDTFMGLGRDEQQVRAALSRYAAGLNRAACYFIPNGDDLKGPFSEEDLLREAEGGGISERTVLVSATNTAKPFYASDIIDFSEDKPERPQSPASLPSVARKVKHRVHEEEAHAVVGESIACPYCRVVSSIEDLLSVSVSPGLRGDSVLGEYEQARFLPTQFNANGLALDAEGGVCTETACPNCHMAFNPDLLTTAHVTMSVIGAPGAGKSVFLASAVWECRQLLAHYFGVSFFDLDPVANRWINAYEEKFFFQTDTSTLQQIAKTDLSDATLTRSVLIDGAPCLLPLPSFFRVKRTKDDKTESLIIYDSAGEHFRAGADTNDSAVTLNMLNADVLYFMFDPSAAPRFRPYLNLGKGTAENYAQRQDVILAEMVARIRRHLGTRSKVKLDRPLIIGISKADLLFDCLDMHIEIYKADKKGRYRLDLGALRTLSDRAEDLLERITPEVVSTARDIADDVWFLPVSALGHNPLKEGVCVADIDPIWAELPIVFTLARRGIIDTCRGA